MLRTEHRWCALWEQAAVGGEEGGEGLGDAIEVVDPDGGVGAPGGDGEGHCHTVVAGGGVVAAF